MQTSAPALDDRRIEHRYAQLESVRLHYVEARPSTPRLGAAPVVLLHGFPEFWYGWRRMIPRLADAGLRVVAPDLRGFGDSDTPRDVASYRMETIADDVAQLVRAIGAERATIVGHDLGGMVAWWLAMRHPELVERLVVMNCPHPGRQLAMMFDPTQLRRSAYMLAFQLPHWPERRLRAGRFALMRDRLPRDATTADAFAPADLERYVEAWDAGIETMLHWYRALLRRSPWAMRRSLRPIDLPVQVIWGARDRHIGFEYAEPPAKWVWHCRFDVLDDASHWLHLEQPERVTALVLEHIGLRGGR